MQKSQHWIDEIAYNKQALIDLFNRIPKKCELPWNQYKQAIKDEGGAQSYSKNQNRGDGGLNGIFIPYWEGKQITDYPEVQDILKHFNFLNPLHVHDITFMTYTPVLHLEPTDRFLEYNIMFLFLRWWWSTFYKGEDKDRNNP